MREHGSLAWMVRREARREARGRTRAVRRGDGAAARDVTDPEEELRRLAGPAAARAYEQLLEAADAYAHERYRDARRVLVPLRERYPGAAAVRELYGITLYRLGHYGEAARELEAFAAMTGSTEQHPVLMDCRRAQGRYREVEVLWDELRHASPSGELVTEGRIVMAGALADQGRLAEAIRLLERGPLEPRRPQSHHLRLWYALADLEERVGNLPRARALFERVRRHEPGFADVADRLAALS